MLATEAEARQAQAQHERFVSESRLREAEWDPAKHPRQAGPPNRGWFATTGGTGGSSSSGYGGTATKRGWKQLRNEELTAVGGPTEPMIRRRRDAADLKSSLQLPGQVTRAAAAGLRSGAKAVVNSSATTIKNVATLGLSTGQLELIGVTSKDRENGYDTAALIGTASGEVLVAVGTGGIASALSKGGRIARAVSGAMVAYDAAGNAVGVVRGTYDAAKNGITLSNGAQVAAGGWVWRRTSKRRRA